MQEDKQSSETEIVPVSEEAGEPELPVSVVSPDGDSWVPDVPASESPKGPEAATVEEAEAFRESAKKKVILNVLEGDIGQILEAVDQAESAEILSQTFDLETAGKNRKIVLQAILRRVSQIEGPVEPEPAAKEVASAEEVAEDPAAKRKLMLKGIKKVLAGNAKSVVAVVKKAEDGETLTLARDLEIADKNRKTVLKAIRKRVRELSVAKPEAEPEYVPPKVVVKVKGNINEIPGSFWEDGVGNIFVLDNKMGAPSGTFALRLFRRAGG